MLTGNHSQSDHGSVASRMLPLIPLTEETEARHPTVAKPISTPCPHLPAHTHPPSTFLETAHPPPAKPRAQGAPPRTPPRLLGMEGPPSRTAVFPFCTTAPAGSRQHQCGQACLGAGVCTLPKHSSFKENSIWLPEQAAHGVLFSWRGPCLHDVKENEYVTEDTQEKKKNQGRGWGNGRGW